MWQARWFGPLYPVLYGGWLVAGGVAGAVVWATRRRGASRSARSSRRAPTTSTRSSGGPTAATATGRRRTRSPGSAGPSVSPLAAQPMQRPALTRRQRPALTRRHHLALTRHAASAAPSSVAGGAPMRYSSSIARHGPRHVELAEDGADAPHDAVEDDEARRHVELGDHRGVRAVDVEDARQRVAHPVAGERELVDEVRPVRAGHVVVDQLAGRGRGRRRGSRPPPSRRPAARGRGARRSRRGSARGAPTRRAPSA